MHISAFLQRLMVSGTLMSFGGNSILIGYGSCRQVSCPSALDSTKPVFYLPDFFLKESHPWLQYSDWCEMSIEEIQHELGSVEESTPVQWHNPYQALFQKNFGLLQNDFANQKLCKAVPYVFAHTSEVMTEKRLKYSLKRALCYIHQYPGYLYGSWHQHQGLLGVTPELLFRYNQDQIIQTFALAGTCHQQSCQVSFKNHPKELREHQIVIEGIKNSLASLGSVKIGELQLLNLPNLSHLITPIEVKTSYPINFEELVRRLHPTPALGAFPYEEGLKWLNSYDQQLNRGRYGAPLGCLNRLKDQFQCLVGIRNVEWDQKGMRIGAGCGVVRESLWEQEWKEINLKIAAICDCLAL